MCIMVFSFTPVYDFLCSFVKFLFPRYAILVLLRQFGSVRWLNIVNMLR